MTSTPRVRLLQAPDDGIVRLGSHKYENVLRADLHAGSVSTDRAWYDELHHETLFTPLRYDPDFFHLATSRLPFPYLESEDES